MRDSRLGLALAMSFMNLIARGTCDCSGPYKVVGPSFKVRGRFSCWNGNPTFRIWIVGTKRMLGIRQGTKLPDNLQALLGDFDTEIRGDFVVCPLTRQRPGVMQIVCISSVSHVSKGSRNQGGRGNTQVLTLP